MTETEEKQLRAVLVGVETSGSSPSAGVEACLDELSELCETDGLLPVGRVTQKREAIHTGHYVGKGKLTEIGDMLAAFEADIVVCDDELTGAQLRNMKKALKHDVIDRTSLILNIFAKRAKSAEGKLQVELASLKYRLSRLTGFGVDMSRIGGGAATYTRGAGETKLELDRRHIRLNIDKLNREIKEIRMHRAVTRTRRERAGAVVVSIVGYTNAGKSTLLNLLSDADVLAEDKLFATLDTTTRRVTLPGGTEILLTDTVGFIQKLSHSLIEAFKATLEEALFADIILHVVDAGNEERDTQMRVVYDTLKQLKCGNTPVITVFNKIDKDVSYPLPHDRNSVLNVAISAKTGENSDKLLSVIESAIKSMKRRITVVIPYEQGDIVNTVHKKCEIVSEEHCEDGTKLVIYADDEMYKRLERYVVSVN